MKSSPIETPPLNLSKLEVWGDTLSKVDWEGSGSADASFLADPSKHRGIEVEGHMVFHEVVVVIYYEATKSQQKVN